MRSGIYRIVCMISGKSYVGQSVNVDGRVRHHFTRLISGTGQNKHLQNAFDLYGAENFVAEILEFCDRELLTQREQFWIDHYGFENLYNMCPAAGSTLGRPFTEEAKANHVGMKGKKHSEETKAKMSEAARGKKKTPEHKAKLSAHRKTVTGWKHSEETKLKISQSWVKRKENAQCRNEQSQ